MTTQLASVFAAYTLTHLVQNDTGPENK